MAVAFAVPGMLAVAIESVAAAVAAVVIVADAVAAPFVAVAVAEAVVAEYCSVASLMGCYTRDKLHE